MIGERYLLVRPLLAVDVTRSCFETVPVNAVVCVEGSDEANNALLVATWDQKTILVFGADILERSKPVLTAAS